MANPKQAVLFLADSDRRLLNSAFLLGKLDTKDLLVSAYYKRDAEKKIDTAKATEAVLQHFKIEKSNAKMSDGKGISLEDRIRELAKECIKQKIHVIAIPTTAEDLNEDPEKISAFVGHEAYDICNKVTEEFVESKKPKDDQERNKLLEEYSVHPNFLFSFMDDGYIYDNRSIYGLNEIFPDKKEEEKTT